MPPWKGESDVGVFEGLQPLSVEEIRTIQRWAETDMPEGEEADLPELPRWPEQWQLGSPDLVVTLSEAYALPADGTDQYRTFVMPLPVAHRRRVRGIEFRPGTRGVVHHANILLDQTSRSRELDDRDPLPGYDGPLARTATYPDGHFLGYTPGRPDPLLPSGLSWRLDPGTDLVVQLHLQPTGRPENIQPSVGFYFTGDEPTRVPYMIRLGRQTLDIAPGQQHYRMTDFYVLPADIRIQALKPHAHYLAREFAAWATLPNGETKRLLHIADWDFMWQNVYRFTAPVALPRGSTLTMEFTYDNSESNPHNHGHPPRRVRWGPASTDEMGDLWVQVLTDDEADRMLIARDFRRKAAAEEIRGYSGLLEREPADPVLNDDIALLYLELGQPAAAVAHFERSLRVRPDSAAGQFNLGTALMLAGRTAEAVSRLEEAVRLKPDFPAAHNNLGGALAAQRRQGEALSHYLTALQLQPDNARAHNGIATLRMEQGQLPEALVHLGNAIELDPDLAEAHHNIALIRQARGEYADAARHFRDAVRLRPESPQMLADCAWILAAAPDDRVRDSARAIELGEMAAVLTRRADARVLDVLAAAFAEAGRFDQALTTLAEAASLHPPDAVIQRLRAHQELYKQRRPARIGSPPR